jgi:hypothetical protein
MHFAWVFIVRSPFYNILMVYITLHCALDYRSTGF